MLDPTLLITLQEAQSLLCISHVNPDGDAVGSLLGMGWLLRRLHKEPVLALQDVPPPEFAWMPGMETLLTAQSPAYPQAVRETPFDVVVCLDASSQDRMGNAYNPSVHGSAPLVVIDHHVTNTYFGHINWVDTGCAATCQMVAYLAQALGVPLQGELAECLLTGLVTDTLCFRTSNTDERVLAVATQLVQGGANLAQITERTINRRPFSLLRLWGLVLPQVRLEDRVIWATVSQNQLQEAGHRSHDTHLSSLLITADEADISAVFLEKAVDDGVPAVECSFRAKPGFDVSRIALQLGGGGHPPASGCTISGPLEEVAAKVVPLLQEVRRAQAIHREQTIRDTA